MYYSDLWVLPMLYKVVMVYDSNFYGTDLAQRESRIIFPFFGNGEEIQRQLKTLFEYPDICEGHISIA